MMLTTRTRIKVLSEIAEERVDCSAPVKIRKVQVEPDNEELEERRERRRKKIITELFETEKTYLHHLEVAHKFFEFPLRFNCLISERAHSQLFSNLEQIHDVNQKLLEHMEQTTVGTAFKFLGPFLKLYSMYANNYQQASATLQENLQKNEKFCQFIQAEEDRPEVMGLKLGALLITPVQRIPRYKLLLEDLLENTGSEHHDYQHLKEAAKQVGEIAKHINEHVRQHENFQKMLTIQNSFDSSAPKILAPGREFIKEGKLNKVSRRGGKAQERMFFLFSDMILYGKSKLLDSGNNSYSCCCVLPLRHCQVEKVLGSVQRSDGGGMFKITCKEESLLLYCTDPGEARLWVDTVEAAIRKLNVNRQTLRKPSSNKVPVRGKSLIKMRLRERKQDLKRKVGKKEPSPEKVLLSPLRTSLRVLAEVDVGNCLTPSKRQRTCSMTSSTDSNMPGSSKDYEENNEICLDNWSPSQSQTGSGDNDENYPGSSLENSLTQSDMEHSDDEEDDEFRHPDDLDSVSTDNQCSGRSSGRCREDAVDVDYSTQPWINPKFQAEKSSSSSCASWPFRRVLQGGTKVTSSIGGVMDSVRSNKRCTIM